VSKAALREGIQRWPLHTWQNGHQNFQHRFEKEASFKLTLPDSLASSSDKYKATTANFMWLIQQAIRKGTQLRAMGNGWSFSEVAVCNGGAVDTKALRLSFTLRNSFVAPAYLAKGGQASNLVLLQCGMSMLQTSEKLEAIGRSLKASGASNGQSIAGATATGTHGAAFNFGAVHDAIVGLHIITGPDRHVWLQKASNPVASDELIKWLGAECISDDVLFNAAVVSFGSFGFIHGVLLETAPLFLLEEHRLACVYNSALKQTLNHLAFDAIKDQLPYPQLPPDKSLYHFEVLINPHQFEEGNRDKGVFVKLFYKTPCRKDYPKRQRISEGFEYGDNTLGLIQTVLDALGPRLSSVLVPPLVNKLLPLAFKPTPVAYGTIGETFANTRFRGQAASAAIGIAAENASRVLEEIVALNKQHPFAGAIAFRYVKGTQALLGFTKFPLTCVLEMDGVDAAHTRTFLQKAWERLENLKIPYTLHWGKINFILNEQRVRHMYGSGVVDQWIRCRHQLLDAPTRNVFNSPFLQKVGLHK
jgi:hypothetical protein